MLCPILLALSRGEEYISFLQLKLDQKVQQGNQQLTLRKKYKPQWNLFYSLYSFVFFMFFPIYDHITNQEIVEISLDEICNASKRVSMINSTLGKPMQLYVEHWIDLEELHAYGVDVLTNVHLCDIHK